MKHLLPLVICPLTCNAYLTLLLSVVAKCLDISLPSPRVSDAKPTQSPGCECPILTCVLVGRLSVWWYLVELPNVSLSSWTRDNTAHLPSKTRRSHHKKQISVQSKGRQAHFMWYGVGMRLFLALARIVCATQVMVLGWGCQPSLIWHTFGASHWGC